ncbi:hypothetical protein I4U23_012555 [Adineta vaga]|nr:hypothetical protein I4U23_012555 [Adineta vaga]
MNNTCSFKYISLRTQLPVQAKGIERTLNYLKAEFNVNCIELPSARYYQTIGPGPELFAVIDTVVFYQVDSHWYSYRTATDIEYGMMNFDQ